MKEDKSPIVFQTVISALLVAGCLILRLIFPNTLQSVREEYHRLVDEIPILDLSEIEEMAFDYDSLSDFRS